MGIYSLRLILHGIIAYFMLLPPSMVSGQYVPVRDREKLPHQYSVMSWTVDDGLPDNHISDILQTSDGFLWIATDNGLSRFDGVSFFNINRRSHPVLLSNRVSSLLEDSKGNLWFGTFGGGLYSIQKDTLLRFTDDMGLPSNYVSSIAEDSSGNIWVGTDGEGLGQVFPDTVISIPETRSEVRNIKTLTTGQGNTLWIGSYQGIFQFHNGLLSEHSLNNQLPSIIINDMYEEDETMWVATPYGLATIRDGEVDDVMLADGGFHASSVIRDIQGNMWIASVEHGAFRISSSSVTKYIHDDPNTGRDINLIYPDREGNIWIGSVFAGLIRLRDEIMTTYSVADGLPHELIFSVTEGKPGEFWIGSADGLTRFTGSDIQTWKPWPTGPENMVLSVHSDPGSDIWIGTRAGRLLKLQDDRLIDGGLSDMPGRAVWVVNSDSRGDIWAGTNFGLYRVNGGTTENFSTRDNILTNNDIRSIADDNNGTLWIGTSYGLNAYKDGEFTKYTEENGLSDQIVVALYPDGNGDIWVGTYGGLHRLRDGIFAAITMEHGLPHDMVGTILEDDYGYLWLGGIQGISRINKNELNDFLNGDKSSFAIRLFGKNDGMKNVTMRISLEPAGWKANDGTLWFATDDGVVMINPADVVENTVPPPVRILSAIIDRTVVGEFSTIPSLELPTRHNQLEITYAAPTFIRPSEVKFRYKLDGLNTEWVDAGTRRSAYFSRIPPGDYTFRVIAANEDGYWNETGASLSIYVQPPFWMTWWFLSIVVVLFLTSGPAIYYRRVTGLERKQTQQREFTMRLINSQEAERARIAAELHDSLGQNMIVIKNRALLGKQEGAGEAMISEQLEEISSTASATLEEMRKISYNLRPFNLERFGLSRSISRAADVAAGTSDIEFTRVIDPIDNILKPASEIHVFRIVQEAMNNVLKHSKAQNASLVVRKGTKYAQVTIRDDGIGFDSSTASFDEGIGLENLRQRSVLIGGKLTIHSKPGQGTILNLTIPLPEEKQ